VRLIVIAVLAAIGWACVGLVALVGYAIVQALF
jgi:hypothetical protein